MTRHIPMMFNPAMVEALLAGRKTETRRILNPQPETYQNDAGETCDIYPFKVEGQTRSRIASGFGRSGVLTTQKCRAEIGDLIWVKETWRPMDGYSNWDFRIRYNADGFEKHFEDGDVDTSDWVFPKAAKTGNVSPLFMPKWASRLTLRVTDFSIEQLHDISDIAAIAEGVECAVASVAGHDIDIDGDYWPGGPVRMYRTLWNSINGPDAWDANPWVDVTKFEVLHQNIQEVAAWD